MSDPEQIFAAGGAMEALVAAKKAGKIRFIGFTGHKDPDIHLAMLKAAERARRPASTPCRCRSTCWTPITGASRRRCSRCSTQQGDRGAGDEAVRRRGDRERRAWSRR